MGEYTGNIGPHNRGGNDSGSWATGGATGPTGSGGTGPTGSTGSAGSTGFTGPTGSAGIVQLAQTVTSGSQSTVDFQSIPGSYSAIEVAWISQDTQAGTDITSLRMKINNDGTSGNYSSSARLLTQNGTAVGTSQSATTAGSSIGAHPQSGNTGFAGQGRVTLVGYAQTTFQKQFSSVAFTDAGTVGSSLTLAVEAGRWKSTAAITRLTFSTDGTAFTNGSIFTLYGLP